MSLIAQSAWANWSIVSEAMAGTEEETQWGVRAGIPQSDMSELLGQRTFPPLSFLRAWISASSVASWPDLKDAVLWFRHMPFVVMSHPCSVILDIMASTAGESSLNCINCLQSTCCFLILTSNSPKHLFLFLGGTLHRFSAVSAHAICFILLKAIFPSSPLSLHRLSPGNYILMFPDPGPISSHLQNLCRDGPPLPFCKTEMSSHSIWTNLPVTVF